MEPPYFCRNKQQETGGKFFLLRHARTSGQFGTELFSIFTGENMENTIV